MSCNAARLKKIDPHRTAMTASAAFDVAALCADVWPQNSVENRK
jgi:hypothetical protein